MTRLFAVALTGWAAWRWLTLVVGLVRVLRIDAGLRREARRACVTRAAATIFVSVAALYTWAQTLRLQPTESFVGLIAAILMVSLVAGVASSFMQPAERSSETLDLFRLRRRSPNTPAAR